MKKANTCRISLPIIVKAKEYFGSLHKQTPFIKLAPLNDAVTHGGDAPRVYH